MPYKNREVQLEAQRKHYRDNKSNYISRQEAARERNRRYVWEFLQTQQCKVCGEKDPVVLEFDHRDRSEKECNISVAMVDRKFSLERLQEELDKCDVLCANCHRRKSAKQLGYNKLSY